MNICRLMKMNWTRPLPARKIKGWHILRNIDLREQPARYHQALNLRGTLEDVEDLRVAEPLGEELFALGVFARCRNAHARGGDFHDQPARVSLAHRGFLRVGNAAIRHPQRAPDQETRHLDLLAQFLQFVLDFAPFMCGKALWQLFADPLAGSL